MLTNDDVGDLNAAVDQVFRCSVLQTLEHRDSELVLCFKKSVNIG